MIDIASENRIYLPIFDRECIEATIDLIIYSVPAPSLGLSVSVYMFSGLAG